MKKKEKITVNFIKECKTDKGEDYISVSEIEFDYPEDAIAYIEALPKDRVVTEIKDISNEETIMASSYETYFDEEATIY